MGDVSSHRAAPLSPYTEELDALTMRRTGEPMAASSSRWVTATLLARKSGNAPAHDPPHAGPGGEVDHGVDLVEQRAHLGGAQVEGHEAEAGAGGERRQVGRPGPDLRTGEVHADDLVAPGHEGFGGVAGDEAGDAGDEDPHRTPTRRPAAAVATPNPSCPTLSWRHTAGPTWRR